MENVHREIEKDSGLIKAIMLPPEANNPAQEHTPTMTPGGGGEGKLENVRFNLDIPLSYPVC
jgi:hypothetical protein